jgi:protein disulfide-isomerase A1
MKYSTICAAFFAAAVAASDVKQLNKDTFKAFVEENDLVLAECKSVSVWALHCITLHMT